MLYLLHFIYSSIYLINFHYFPVPAKAFRSPSRSTRVRSLATAVTERHSGWRSGMRYPVLWGNWQNGPSSIFRRKFYELNFIHFLILRKALNHFRRHLILVTRSSLLPRWVLIASTPFTKSFYILTSPSRSSEFFRAIWGAVSWAVGLRKSPNKSELTALTLCTFCLVDTCYAYSRS